VSGYGLFFDVYLMLAILGGGGLVSCLWWWPFVRHISRPLLKMTAVSEKLATADASALLHSPPGANLCDVDPSRGDEIGRLAQSINVMAHHLYGTLARQRQFISHIAHEINSPLARVQLGLAVMEDRMTGDAQERVRKIITEVEHLSVLTGSILNFLRTESEYQTPLFERIELCPFIMEVINTEASSGNVHLAVADNLAVTSSRRYLGRAIANVLRNSIKYAGETILVEIKVAEQNGKVCITITDKGPGVPEDELPLLAKPFFRSSSCAGESGAGLGLSIVKYCIEACNGSVSFANNKPTGFVVTMHLPVETQ
jgi:Signal transduction histidine kinase